MRLAGIQLEQIRCLVWQNSLHKNLESTTWKFLWLIKVQSENKQISQLVNARRELLNLF